MGSGYRWQLGQESAGGQPGSREGETVPMEGKTRGRHTGRHRAGALASGKLRSEDWVPASCQRRADGFSWRPGPRAPSDSCVPSPGCRINSCSCTSCSGLSLDQRGKETEPHLRSVSREPARWVHDPLNLPDSPQGKRAQLLASRREGRGSGRWSDQRASARMAGEGRLTRHDPEVVWVQL